METLRYCEYGCGNLAKYQNKSRKWMCHPSQNSCPVNREKNSHNLTKAYSIGKRDQRLAYARMSDEKKQNMCWNRGKRSANFVYNGSGSLDILPTFQGGDS